MRHIRLSDLRQVTDGAASYVQPSFTPDGKSVYAGRVYEPLDWSWTYSHLVLVPLQGLLEPGWKAAGQ